MANGKEIWIRIGKYESWKGNMDKGRKIWIMVGKIWIMVGKYG